MQAPRVQAHPASTEERPLRAGFLRCGHWGLMHLRFAHPAFLSALLCAGGCSLSHPVADADTSRDAGRGSDAGPRQSDAGPAPTDAAPLPRDSAPPSPDAGPGPGCVPIPSTLEGTIVPGPIAYHGIVFDDAGNLVGGDYEHVFRTPRGASPSVWAANVGQTEQLARHPDGNVYVVADQGVTRVAPSGAHERIFADGAGYAIKVGPQRRLWITTYNGIVRLDPATGAREVFSTDQASKTLEFSQDGRTLYFGTVSDAIASHVYRWRLDDDHRPIGTPEIFARNVGDGYHDSLRLDACGYLWVTEFYSSSLYRISPDGNVEKVIDWNFDDFNAESRYGHGITWGTGNHGWRSDAIYLPMPYLGNQVQEIVINVGEARRSW